MYVIISTSIIKQTITIIIMIIIILELADRLPHRGCDMPGAPASSGRNGCGASGRWLLAVCPPSGSIRGGFGEPLSARRAFAESRRDLDDDQQRIDSQGPCAFPRARCRPANPPTTAVMSTAAIQSHFCCVFTICREEAKAKCPLPLRTLTVRRARLLLTALLWTLTTIDIPDIPPKRSGAWSGG